MLFYILMHFSAFQLTSHIERCRGSSPRVWNRLRLLLNCKSFHPNMGTRDCTSSGSCANCLMRFVCRLLFFLWCQPLFFSILFGKVLRSPEGISLVAGQNNVSLYFSVVTCLQAAQEKEELQRLGDELEAKVRKGEKEIIAMENTLKLLAKSNHAFRTSLNPVHPQSKVLCDIVISM